MTQCDVLIHFSLSDVYPTVVTEALSLGLPVIASDIPGVGDLIDDRCGILVNSHSISEMIRCLSDSIVRLASSVSLLEELSHGCHERIKGYDFLSRMGLLDEIYYEILN